MKSAAELEKNLMSINRRSYPAYKDLRGSYQFQGYQLNIDHVQGDPFASPSKLSIQVKKIQARFPEEYYKEEHRRIALQDYLTRQFGKAVSKFIFQAKGSGKSGLIGISRCGQEVWTELHLKLRMEIFWYGLKLDFRQMDGRSMHLN